MKLSDLTESERRVWQEAVTGMSVDLRVGDTQLDSPEKWAGWGMERIIRAEVIADLLIGDGDAASTTVRGVRLQGARITGDLNLEATTLRCPLALLDCSLACTVNLNEATAVSVRLSGSHVPAVRARQLLTRGDLLLDEGFSVSGGVDLAVAHIGGELDCTGGHFANPDGRALNAYGLTVDGGIYCRGEFSSTGEVNLIGAHIGGQLSCTGGHFFNHGDRALTADGLAANGGMVCGEGFSASGEVRLAAAHIGGQLSCTGGHFANPDGRALSADRLTVDGSMVCGEGFSASGEVRLVGAHIGGQLSCTGGHFANPDGDALSADGLTVDGSMVCGEGFSASGEVRLVGAHIGGQLSCTGGHFAKPTKPDAHALSADGLTVDGDVLCGESFKADGEVRLVGAHIGGQLACGQGQFSNPKGSALNLRRATVSGPLRMDSAVLEGILDLTAAKTSSYRDSPTSRRQKIRLNGFVYDAIEGASAKERLDWLRRNEKGYSPQIYEQLAAVYRRSGDDKAAQHILIAKQRCHFAQRNFLWRLWSHMLDGMVSYGYHTERAVLWLLGWWFFGTVLFDYLFSRGDLTPASTTITPPPFQPYLYTLDLLLPVASLHIRDAWIAHGVAQICSVVFIIIGWVLATAVVLSLARFLKRDS